MTIEKCILGVFDFGLQDAFICNADQIPTSIYHKPKQLRADLLLLASFGGVQSFM